MNLKKLLSPSHSSIIFFFRISFKPGHFLEKIIPILNPVMILQNRSHARTRPPRVSLAGGAHFSFPFIDLLRNMHAKSISVVPIPTHNGVKF